MGPTEIDFDMDSEIPMPAIEPLHLSVPAPAKAPGSTGAASTETAASVATATPPTLSAAGGEPERLSPPDAQRAALRDLVALAAEVGTTESRLERDVSAAAKDAGEALEKSNKTIQFRNEALRHQAAQKQKALQDEVVRLRDTDLQAIRQIEEPARQRAQAELDQVEQVVQRKTREATWLADSDLEVALNALAAEEKKHRQEHEQQLASISTLEMALLRRAATFGHRGELKVDLPAAPPAPLSADAGTDDETRDASQDPLADFKVGAADPASSVSGAQRLLEESAAAARTAREKLDAVAVEFQNLSLPRLFVGVTPWLTLLVMAAVGAGAGWVLGGMTPPNVVAIAAGGGGMLVLTLLIGSLLARSSKKQVRVGWDKVEEAVVAARRSTDAQAAAAEASREKVRARAMHRRETEVRMAQDRYAPGLVNARRKMDAAIAAIESQSAANHQSATDTHAARSTSATDRGHRIVKDAENRLQLDLQAAQLHHDRVVQEARDLYDREKKALQDRMELGLQTIHAPMERDAAVRPDVPLDWQSPVWATWKPSKAFAAAVRFGRLHVDLMKIARASAEGHEPQLALPAPFELPAVLAFPSRASLLVQADRDGRADGIRAVQMVMARLLVSLPAGRVRFTLLDPIGLGQNFAGFMHLADHDEALVGGRIWTETDQIDQRLSDLTGHMETVIQKYLRNEFETIDDYNAQAGELAEPYRFLVVSDFPAGFSEESLRRLSSVASSGARCGVYTLVFHDTRQPLPVGSTTLDDVARSSVNLVREDGRFVWRDPVFEQFPLSLDPPPSESALTRICDVVGRGAKEAARVEVPFETIAPPAGKFWSQDSGGDLSVPIGRTGATRLQSMRLGKGVAQHVLIAGKTGSGKSSLLHALVTNLAMWYSPHQVEFYLVDFKKGVEFKTYATHQLPHARAIAVESDREFGLSVLQRLDAELTRRGELFRAAGVQDLAAYRRSPEPQIIPRTLLIVDEFQEFFSEDDKLAQESGVLLDRLVRQGRAFGIHCLLGSQTIGGGSSLPRTTIGQMAVRIALQTSDADSQLILGDSNSAARLLSRPGEAIYNDQGGLVEGNSPFQVAWLSDSRKDAYLAQVKKAADEKGIRMTPPIVFEGNAPADLSKNQKLLQRLRSPEAPVVGPPTAWLGEPVAIKDPTGVAMRRQSGANLLVIGQAEESALAVLSAALISLATQLPRRGTAGATPAASQPFPDAGAAALPAGSLPAGSLLASLGSLDDPPAPAPELSTFYILDATPADSTLAGAFARIANALPSGVRVVDWRATESAIGEIATEIVRRRDQHDAAAAPIYLFINGLQRYRVLRKSEEDFSFGSSSGEPKPADPGKQFAEILKEGPSAGVHTLAWIDTAVAIDRTLDRGSMREFDNRVLFQMSANDSSNLIDSPAANKLGFYRALAYSEEQGVMEKFRPYGLPSDAVLRAVSQRLK